MTLIYSFHEYISQLSHSNIKKAKKQKNIFKNMNFLFRNYYIYLIKTK